MHIMLTNDDGIQAVGLRALYHAFLAAGHTVEVVAPVTEMSAVGHAVTLALPLRVKRFNEADFKGLGVSGTPVDCVKLGLSSLLSREPEIVVSGINAGANVGVDLLYSGTVAAATEAAFMGRKALAVSFDGFSPTDLSEQAAWVAARLDALLVANTPEKCVLNLNFPDRPLAEAKGIKVCPHTSAMYDDTYEERADPRGHPYYWISGTIPPGAVSPETDRALLTEGHITLTPLRFDFTDHGYLAELAGLAGLA